MPNLSSYSTLRRGLTTSRRQVRFPRSDGKSDIFQIFETRSPHLVPSGYIKDLNKSGILDLSSHIRWLMQKAALRQDMFLMGAPGPLRRRLALAFCELSGREVELLTLSQDTTEADLKQRREIKSGSAVYVDQAPLRAALEGRVLILDGMEKAERNVLPTLNNLLENREMSLSDGRFLVSPTRYDSLLANGESIETLRRAGLLRVSEHFQVIALGLPVPEYPGYPLDPPLRSRFQGRYIQPLGEHELIQNLVVSDGAVHATISDVASFFQTLRLIKTNPSDHLIESNALSSPKLLPVPETALLDFTKFIRKHPDASARDVVQMVYPYQFFGLDSLQKRTLDELSAQLIGSVNDTTHLRDPVEKSTYLAVAQKEALSTLLQAHEVGEDSCLVGEKGEGKVSL